MYIDLQSSDPAALDADVCVIGAGIAGITVARRLLTANKSVILLESGGLDYETDAAELNIGRSVGEDYYDLEHARLRMFGGTTAIWGGRCAQLSPVDFEKRDWVPHSGWPITAEDLAPYYLEARGIFGLPPDSPVLDRSKGLGRALPHFDESELTVPLWSFDDQLDRFSFRRCQDVVTHPRCTVVTHATVTQIVAAPSGKAVTGIDVQSPIGRRLSVHATSYVLAAGGIENPRILLASRSTASAGLGNDHDQVGRYFMEHPHARGGRITGAKAWLLLSAFNNRHQVSGGSVAPLIAPSHALQRREGLMNTSLTIAPRPPEDGSRGLGMKLYLQAKHGVVPDRHGRMAWKGLKAAARWGKEISHPLRPWLLHRMGKTELALLVRAEQAPNPQSRVTLGSEVDATGMPRSVLNWQLSRPDFDSVAGLIQALGRELRRLELGDVEMQPWLQDPAGQWKFDPLVSSHPIGGYHHMGTTRMSEDPKHGVTNARAQLHGIDNLYIAGSSLFPTSGWANPTLTIAALSLRIADDIIASIDQAVGAVYQNVQYDTLGNEKASVECC